MGKHEVTAVAVTSFLKDGLREIAVSIVPGLRVLVQVFWLGVAIAPFAFFVWLGTR